MPTPIPSTTHATALGGGWTLDPTPSDAGGTDWTVCHPTIGSASLAFAIDQGTTSCDGETPIPARVLARLDTLADVLASAGLW